MVAASRSGSTSALMRLSSPKASILASHSSRPLELGRAWPTLPSFEDACCCGATDTLISMTFLIQALATVRPVAATLLLLARAGKSHQARGTDSRGHPLTQRD